MTTLYAYVPYTYRPHAALAHYAIMLEHIIALVAQHPTCLQQQQVRARDYPTLRTLT